MRKIITAAVSVAMFAGAFALMAPAAHAIPHCDGETIVGTFQNDRLVGTDCDDSIYGLPGNDVLRGRLGYDVLRGGRGDDVLSDLSFLVGGELRGGRGFDRCIVAEGSDVQIFSCEEIVEV